MNTNLTGIALMVMGMFLFTMNDAIGKWLVTDYAVGQLIAVRSFAALAVLLPILWKKGLLKGLFVCERPWLHTLRVILVVAEVSCFYWSVRYLPLADVFMFYLASPIFVTVLSVMFLGEKVGVYRWAAVLSGFVGVVLIFPPSEAALTLPALVALGGSLSMALILILARQLKGAGGFALITYQTLGVAAVGTATLPITWITPTPVDLALLCLLGLVATAAHFMLNRSVAIAPASVVAPFQYTAIIWAMILGYAVWGDVPSIQAVAGAVLVVGAGLLILHRERRELRSQDTDALAVDEVL